MKVALVMPLDSRSAIADVTLRAVPTLAVAWELVVWAPRAESMRTCPVPVRVFDSPTPDIVAELRGYDLVVYVLGDSAFHAAILPLCRSLPGLVVLHDAAITNLAVCSAVEFGWLDELMRHLVLEHGPDEALAVRDRSSLDALQWLQLCSRIPLTECALDTSLGAVVHSRWHAAMIEGRTLGEVRVQELPIPTLVRDAGPLSDGVAAMLSAIRPDTVLVVTVGHVNANRCVDRLLAAVGSDSGLRDRVAVWAVGAVASEMRDALEREGRRAGGVALTLTGRVTDGELTAILDRADIGVALRDPVLEGTSASALTQMRFGLPLVVLDHGHYSELPDSAVVKVDPSSGPGGVARGLLRLVERPEERVKMGAAARRWATRPREAADYAQTLIDAGTHALATRPFMVMATETNRALLTAGLEADRTVVNRVLELGEQLFGLSADGHSVAVTSAPSVG